MRGAEPESFKRFRELTLKLAAVPKREVEAQRKKPKRSGRASKPA